MKLDDFDFDLPQELIAQHPVAQRTQSRLLHVSASGELNDLIFTELCSLLKENDLLVRNNVKVIKARIFGQKASGGKLECLLERVLDDKRVLTQLRASKSPKQGDTIYLAHCPAVVLNKQQGFYELELLMEAGQSIDDFVESVGHLPLPPYIQREDDDFDEQRYQTVYAREPGAVAAPTAGLHFDEALFKEIEEKGVQVGETTLYVGSGTFQPVRVDDIKAHKMHSERFVVSESLVKQIEACRAKGGRVIALGTTSLRALESAAASGQLQACSGETDIFIYPGFCFQCVDALITNFHLPKSTLMMLVSAFSGMDNIQAAYQHAVNKQYRFFSYGDAMFLEGGFLDGGFLEGRTSEKELLTKQTSNSA